MPVQAGPPEALVVYLSGTAAIEPGQGHQPSLSKQLQAKNESRKERMWDKNKLKQELTSTTLDAVGGWSAFYRRRNSPHSLYPYDFISVPPKRRLAFTTARPSTPSTPERDDTSE
ncbi:hypothetical protein MHYP_G00095060 [Metynnis hypsauchen]